ncbi:MAG: glycine zipper 2TM domain-containing protein [Rhodospirillales bacterium]|nr:glycine zipper 2TM domain-containing protein [Rhodospirillales bacterium]
MPILKQVTRIATIMVLGIPLIACQAMRDNPKEIGGTLVGAALGVVLGSQIGSGEGRKIAIGVSQLSGAFAGREIGKSLDETDRF